MTGKWVESDVIDEVSLMDKQFFEDHPDAQAYVRAYVDGEFVEEYEGQVKLMVTDDSMLLVRVDNVLPGVRTRIPFIAPKIPIHLPQVVE